MYKLLLIILTFTLLSANNPKPYAALGDVIYNNVDKIEALSYLESYSLYSKEIDAYVSEVKAAKIEGIKLEMGEPSISKKDYLNRLRKLSKTNDYFVRGIRSNFKNSMNTNNYKLFSVVINSGLMDTEKHKNEIIDYYYKHQDQIDPKGVIEEFLNKDAKLKALKEAQRRKYKTKKMLEEEKIKRIRAEDKEAQKALELKLQKELENKKLKIREEQKKELAN